MNEVKQQYDVEIGLETKERLRTRALEGGDDTYEDVILRLLDETKKTISLEKFLERLVEAVDPAQIALHRVYGELSFVIHTPEELDTELVNDVDAVSVDSQTYRFRLEKDPHGPQDVGRITVYAPNGDADIGPVTVEQGVERVKDWMDSRETRG